MPRPLTLLVLCPLQAEYRAIVKGLRLSSTWNAATAERGGRRVVALWIGLDRELAGRRVAEAINDGDGYDAALLCGFAGGLDPTLRPGDVVQLDRALDEEGSTVELNQRPEPRHAALTLDRAATTPADKAALFDQTGALIADMETLPHGVTVTNAGLPMIAVRAVLDDAWTAIPAASVKWLKPDGRPNLWRVLLWLATRPWELGTLIGLGVAQRRAGKRLASATARLIDDLDPAEL